MERYTKEQRNIIVQTYYKYGENFTVTARKIRAIFGRRNAPHLTTIMRLIKKFKETGSVVDQVIRVKNHPARSMKNIAAVYESVAENPGISIRHRAQQLNISRSSLQRILSKDLSLHAYNIQLNQELRPLCITNWSSYKEEPSEVSNGVTKLKVGCSTKAASKRPEVVDNHQEESKKKPQKRKNKSKGMEDMAKLPDERAKSNEIEEKVVEKSIQGDSEHESPKAKKGHQTNKKSAGDKNGKQDKPLINETNTNYTQIKFDCERENTNGEEANFKIASWNVDGLRAWLKKDGLTYITKENPDILCLQEIKCNSEQFPSQIKDIKGYEAYWQESEKDGYAGVALLSRTKPIDVKYGIGDKEHDDEGRCITAEFEKFYVVSVYVPNAGRKLVTLPKRLEWNKAFKSFVKDLDENKPVIICGDMNVAHNEIDLANPKTNKKNAGFTQEERDGMTDFLSEGFVDSFREFYPNKKNAYTFWTYMAKARVKNIGWRLDYFLVSSRFMDNICDNVIRSQIFGSDHCPIVLFLHI